MCSEILACDAQAADNPHLVELTLFGEQLHDAQACRVPQGPEQPGDQLGI